ncbi:hypothetical protein QJ857_gp1178 [Tupanvirus soda lake]|uniref:Uncharacterized protein n=2 Tax=Tupanvirus TaxID=2094720 RepID=A0A6N1NQ59_9VIRU|nr:hypothetical protein QJ857_gp1178 [Tupanvirus soda lake]QKU34877.1 hypothetical protein [Tupanvirus soda lake]
MGIIPSKKTVKPVILKLIDKPQKGGITSLLSDEDDVYEKFYKKLVEIPEDKPIDIIITTHGGSAIWCSKICYVLSTRSGKSRVFVKHYAHSAGAVIALSASELYITYDTTLSAIDAQGFPLSDLFTTSINKLATLVQHPKQAFIDLTNSRSNYFRENVEKYLNAEHNKELIMQKMHDQSPIHEQLFFKNDFDDLGIKYKLWNGDIRKRLELAYKNKSLKSNTNIKNNITTEISKTVIDV